MATGVLKSSILPPLTAGGRRGGTCPIIPTSSPSGQEEDQVAERASAMTFEEAANYKIPFGKKYKGKTLAAILETDPRWIKWLWKSERKYGPVRRAINAFVKDESVKQRLAPRSEDE